jgi:hypothetical protein
MIVNDFITETLTVPVSSAYSDLNPKDMLLELCSKIYNGFIYNGKLIIKVLEVLNYSYLYVDILNNVDCDIQVSVIILVSCIKLFRGEPLLVSYKDFKRNIYEFESDSIRVNVKKQYQKYNFMKSGSKCIIIVDNHSCRIGAKVISVLGEPLIPENIDLNPKYYMVMKSEKGFIEHMSTILNLITEKVESLENINKETKSFIDLNIFLKANNDNIFLKANNDKKGNIKKVDLKTLKTEDFNADFILYQENCDRGTTMVSVLNPSDLTNLNIPIYKGSFEFVLEKIIYSRILPDLLYYELLNDFNDSDFNDFKLLL